MELAKSVIMNGPADKLFTKIQSVICEVDQINIQQRFVEANFFTIYCAGSAFCCITVRICWKNTG